MKILHKAKDGGPESNVTGYWLIEAKGLLSLALLKITKGSREAFHNHAFNAWSWLFCGCLREEVYYDSDGEGGPAFTCEQYLLPSLKPIYTSRDRMHKVHGEADVSWAITFRGPWNKVWKETFPEQKKVVTLSNGRNIEEVVYG